MCCVDGLCAVGGVLVFVLGGGLGFDGWVTFGCLGCRVGVLFVLSWVVYLGVWGCCGCCIWIKVVVLAAV